MIDYYHILGVSSTATADEIKTAFKAKARKYHPDKHGGDPTMEELFKEINHAYQILSNPYERARYDLQRNFGHQSQQTASPSSPTPNYPPPYTRRYRSRKIDYRENWIATAYAFGFSMLLALIIMGGISIKEYYDEKAWNEKLERRRASFEAARNKYENGKITEALVMMNELGGFLTSENDLEQFKVNIINNAVSNGKKAFESGEFEEAVFYFELLRNHTNLPNIGIRENLAYSYRQVNKPLKSIKLYNELIISGYRNLMMYVEVAEIYRDELRDIQSANNFFKSANKLATEYYKAIYGNAYALIIDGEDLPPIHYKLYVGLVDSYLKLGEYEKAISATVWNKRVWPDSASNYEMAGFAYEKLEDFKNACQNYQLAKELNPQFTLPGVCR